MFINIHTKIFDTVNGNEFFYHLAWLKLQTGVHFSLSGKKLVRFCLHYVGFKSMVDHPPLAQGSGFHVRKLHDPMVFIRNYALTSRTSRKKNTRPCEFHRTFRLFTIVMSRGQGFTYNEIAFHPDPANFHHSDVAYFTPTMGWNIVKGSNQDTHQGAHWKIGIKYVKYQNFSGKIWEVSDFCTTDGKYGRNFTAIFWWFLLKWEKIWEIWEKWASRTHPNETPNHPRDSHTQPRHPKRDHTTTSPTHPRYTRPYMPTQERHPPTHETSTQP